MNSIRWIGLVAVAALFALTSCSGVKNPCTVNCGGGGGGSASLNLVLTDTPPTGLTVLSFTLPISGISLTPSSGSNISIYPGGTFEMTRLQSDTSGVAVNVNVPAGTYTAININLGTSSGTYINTSGSTVTSSAGTCLNGEVCPLPAGAATQITIPVNVTLSNTSQWLGLDFNLNRAITPANGITVDFSQLNVMSVNTIPPTGTLPTGNTAYIDDFTGFVQTITGNSITINSTARGSLTAVISSSTPVFDPQTQCSGNVSIACIQPGSVVSFQGVLSTNGTITATSLDVIDASTSPADEVEGTVYPSACNGGGNLGLILSDSSISTASSPLASAKFGQGVCLTLSQAVTFAIDTGILTGQPGAPTFTGFSSGSDLVAGQTVRAKITGAATGTNGINATATAMILRFTRMTAIVSIGGSTVFTVTSIPGYITTLPVSGQVATYPNATLLENFTSISSLASPDVVSISALLLNPTSGVQYPLHAAKVRLQ